MDGVLVNSTPLHTKAWQIYLTQRGLDPAGIEDRMLGLRNEELVGELFGMDMPLAERRVRGLEKEALYRELMAPVLEEHLVPGVRDFLERHRDIPMAVVSNAERANIDLVLDGAGIRSYFTAIVDGSQVERPKPFPDIYLIAASQVNSPTERCIIFEDSPTGIKAATDSGARVVGLRTSLQTLPRVDLAVDDFHATELQKWLASL